MLPGFVLLDRDGVINVDSDDYIKSPQEWWPVPGSLEAIALLNANNFKVVVISNQSGVARGFFNLTTLAKIHAKMQQCAARHDAEIEAVYFCPHGVDEHCLCRKPKPGLFKQFARDYRLELTGLPYIGDSYRDIQVARAVNASPMLVKTGKGRQTLIENPQLDIPVFENLYDAAKFIVTEN